MYDLPAMEPADERAEPKSGVLLPTAVYSALVVAAIVVFLIALRIGDAVDQAWHPAPPVKVLPPPIIAVPVTRAATPARGNVAQFFSADEYPADAMRRGEQGRTVAKLAITSAGTVSACTIQVSSGSAALDAATCRVALTRARFQPARDAAGSAIASSYTLPVRWVLPIEREEPRQGATTPAKKLPIMPGIIALAEAYVVARALAKGELTAKRSGKATSRASSPRQYWSIVAVHAFIASGAIVATVEGLTAR